METSKTRKESDPIMVAPRKDPEMRTCAVRRIADQLGVHPEALRTWVKRAETDEGSRPGTTSGDAARIAGLERENRELKRANAILKSASAFFAAELCATKRDVDQEAVKDSIRWASLGAA